MDALRRGAMQKLGKLFLGAGAAGTTLGRAGQVQATQGLNKITGYDKALVDWNGPAEAYPQPIQADPVDRAKSRLARPIRDQIEKLEYGRARIGNYGEPFHMQTMRSVSPWFKQVVAMEEQRKRASLIQSLRDQINDIFKSPVDDLKKEFGQMFEELLLDVVKK